MAEVQKLGSRQQVFSPNLHTFLRSYISKTKLPFPLSLTQTSDMLSRLQLEDIDVCLCTPMTWPFASNLDNQLYSPMNPFVKASVVMTEVL